MINGADHLKCKAVFLDFYGTLVHEDDAIIPLICDQIRAGTDMECSAREIGSYWWKEFSTTFRNSYGDSFQSQRAIGLRSLSKTIENFKSGCLAEELIQKQFEHWTRPVLYPDTIPFLQALGEIPVYILSNIDTADIMKAVEFHNIKVTDILTSEDVKSYKPRPELFNAGLKRSSMSANEVIHIGDSLLSDVGGAQNLGISAIWLNRLNKTLPEGSKPDFVCKDLNEAQSFLLRRGVISHGGC